MKTTFSTLCIGVLALTAGKAHAEATEEATLLSQSVYHVNLGLGMASNPSDNGNMDIQKGETTRSLPTAFSGSDSYVLKLELSTNPMQGWGHSLGLQYVGPHRMEFSEIDAAWTASQSTLYSNLIYRWQVFYASFGANLTHLKAKVDSADLTIGRIATDFGWQIGAGWKLTRSLAIEYAYMSNSLDMELRRVSSGERYRWRDGYLNTNMIMLTYMTN